LNINFFKTWSKQKNIDLDEILEIVDSNHFKTKHHGVIFDFSSISFQCSFGLKNQRIENVLKKQIDKISFSNPNYQIKIQKDVSENLIKLVKQKGKVFYTTSGAESVSNAIKITRQATGKKLIYSLKKSYHGAIDEALEVTGDWRRENHNIPRNHHRWLPDPSTDPTFSKSLKVLTSNSDNLCGIIIEPTSGKNGVFTPPQEWWRNMIKAKKELGFKVIVDEVVCGFYRTGNAFGHHAFPIKPDVICMAKAISGGFVPFGAVFFNNKISKCFANKILSAGLTNYAHPLGLSATATVLNIINSTNFKRTLKKNMELLKDFEHSLKSNYTTRINGMLLAVDFNEQITKEYFLNSGLGVIVNNKTLILAPSLNCPPSLLKKNLKKLASIINGQIRESNVFKKIG
jgi:taurine---2-oxoglutarate transaminase